MFCKRMKDSVREFLEEALFDENKVVTYKCLSRNLELSMQEAKNNLEDFFIAHKEDKGLFAVYYVSGEVERKDYKVTKVCLVREKDLDKAKLRCNPLHGYHIYSIQCADLKDLGPVYSADLEDDAKKTQEDIGRLQIAPNIISGVDMGARKVSEEVSTKNDSSRALGVLESSKSVDDKKEVVVEERRKSPRKSQAETKSVPTTEQTAAKKVEKPGKKKQGSVSAMFSAMGQKAAEKKEKEEETTKRKEAEKEMGEKEKATKEPQRKSQPKMPSRTPEKKPVEQRVSARRKRAHIDSNSDEDRQTGAGTLFSSSSTTQKSMDDIFAAEVSSPEPSPVKRQEVRRSPRKMAQKQSQSPSSSSSRNQSSPPKNNKSRGKRKILPADSLEEGEGSVEKSSDEEEVLPPTPVTRKVVETETFLDDEGFLVVKKTSKTVTESCSADSSNAPNPKPKGSPHGKKSPKRKGFPAKKKTRKESPKKQKQATLTNFFMKK